MLEHLGVIYAADGNAISHRSLLKVILNPFLRLFGYCIATMCDWDENGKLTIIGGIRIMKSTVSPLKWYGFQLSEGDTVVKKRMLV